MTILFCCSVEHNRNHFEECSGAHLTTIVFFFSSRLITKHKSGLNMIVLYSQKNVTFFLNSNSNLPKNVL